MKITVSSMELHLLRILAEGRSEEHAAAMLQFSKSTIIECKKSLLRRIGEVEPLKALQVLARTGFTIEDRG